MGQSPSSEPPNPEIQAVDPPKPTLRVVDYPNLHLRILDPPTRPPTGLALIAHGRNAAIDCPVVDTLAKCLREKHGCRTVTWSARGVGNSEGTEGSHLENRIDYNRMLEMAMDSFTQEFPEITDCRLFICGHDFGAMYAGTVRPPSSPCFDRKTRYILISYPARSVGFTLRGTGNHYRALESLVRGGSLAGEEPPAEILLITGREYTRGVRTLCALWIEIQTGNCPGENLKMEIVEGADHNWNGHYDKITGITGKWLSQQHRSEVQPPIENTSTAGADQAPPAPVVLRTLRGRASRFLGQVL